MKLHVGSDIVVRTEADCPIVAMLRPASGLAQWLSSETYVFEPWVPTTEYVDSFGNLCQRLIVPRGDMRLGVEDIEAPIPSPRSPPAVSVIVHLVGQALVGPPASACYGATMSSRDDATTLLMQLAAAERVDPKRRHEYVDGPELTRQSGLGPGRLNNAVEFLEENGYLEVLKTFGTAPYDFNSVKLTSRGRFEAERLEELTKPTTGQGNTSLQLPTIAGSGHVYPPTVAGENVPDSVTEGRQPQETTPAIVRFPHPVGSPFGFSNVDWESVSLDWEDAGRLIVVFGHQWKSNYFDSAQLRAVIQEQFQTALTAAVKLLRREIVLDFRPLEAGYGRHLFTDIARDVMGADIAVFETSDLNPNVMIEMGVALTWDTRVHPIRRVDAPEPPSDISGQTWAVYETETGGGWDVTNERRLTKMVELACKRKPRRG